MTHETQKQIRRVESSTQTEMFGPASASDEPRQRLNEKGFVDPDPEQIVYGAYRLQEFLVRVGQDAALLVRDVVRSVDFSDFEAEYSLTGRAPYHPAIMLGLIIYGIMHGQSTLRDLEALAARDLGAHWITGGVIPDHSTIGKFIQRHTSLITVEFFEALTAEVLRRAGTISQVWAADGTTIESAANRYRTLRLDVARELAEELEAESSEPRAEDDDLDDDAGSDDAAATGVRAGTEKTLDLEKLRRAVEVGEQRAEQRKRHGDDPETTQVCTTDPEAGIIKHKRDGRFGPGWIPSVMTMLRYIIAQTTHPCSEMEAVVPMFEQAKRVTGILTAILLMDSNYHSFRIAKAASSRDLLLICPPADQARCTAPNDGDEDRTFDKHYDFEWLPEQDAYRCPPGHLLTYSHTNRDKRRGTERRVYRTSASNCGSCEVKGSCTTADRRQVTRDLEEHRLEYVRQLMNNELAAQLYEHRRTDAEPVFSELKGAQGLERFRRSGTDAVSAEFSLHACAHNLRRLQRDLRRRAGGAIYAVFVFIDAHLRLLRRMLQMLWAFDLRSRRFVPSPAGTAGIEKRLPRV